MYVCNVCTGCRNNTLLTMFQVHPNSDPSIRSDITRHFNQSVVILLAIADLTHTAECDHDDERVRFGNVVAAQPFAMIPDDLVILSSLFDLSA